MSRFNTPLETNVVLFGRLDSRLWVVNILQSSGLFLAVEKGEDGADRLLFTRHLLQEIANAAKRLKSFLLFFGFFPKKLEGLCAATDL